MADLNIAPKYAKFFLKNLNTRHVLLCGSRRSGKSYNIFKWNTLRSLGSKPIHTIVCTASFPAAKLAISDFQDATGISVQGSVLTGYAARFPNGSVVQFMSFDRPTKAQGSHCDIAIVEEALNIPEDVLSVFLLGVRKQVYFVFNPTRGGVIDKYILPDRSNFLVTTFKDNPYLGKEQLEEFEMLRVKGTSPTASVIDRYNYKVYYCGEFTSMAGKVFREVYSCTDDFYKSIPAVETFGLDFGYVDSADSTCLVGSKIFDNCLYLRQYINSVHLAKDRDLAMEMARQGLDCYSYICGDYGGLGGTRMKALCSAADGTWTETEICKGFNVINARKGKVVDGLSRMLNYDKIIVTEDSVDLRAEMDRYELGPEGEEKSKHQNLVDAARYSTRMHEVVYG